MRILTFGSCLSRYTAETFVEIYGGELVSCSYHNRIDQFVETHIRKNVDEFPIEFLTTLNLSIENQSLVNNQYKDINLGKHLLENGELFFDAIKNGVDLIICDNFMDLCSKLYVLKNSRNNKIFINSRLDPSIKDSLIEEKEFLDIGLAVDSWNYFSHYLAKVAPNAKRFFINFPYNHHKNIEISKRSKQFSKDFSLSPKIEIIPNIEIPERYMLSNTQSHFSNDVYAMYAGLINFRVRGLHLTMERK